ncbi:MAG TPA: nucleotidyltransferase domain-containing protein, partial [Armatimonadota bacterium]|nr:nucleotidyltransferase domain-containing protein [Armatimonadota bacterium]
ATRTGLGKQDIQPILDELKVGLKRIYGDRLKQVILFGSFARGEAESDLDIDVAVVLDDYESPFQETERLSEFGGRVSLDNDVVVQFMYVRERDISDPREPLHHNITREGVSA